MELVLSFVATLLVTPVVVRLSGTLGLVDQPSDDYLKIHRRPIPRSGGIAVGTGLVVALLVARPGAALIVGGGAALAIGLLDDRFGLSPAFRLGAEALAAVAASILALGTGSWVVTLFGAAAIVTTINAANLFDGMDGLLSGSGLISAVGLALLLAPRLDDWLWALAGALAGFLAYNRPPARIFLGDGGAYVVGAVAGVAIVQLFVEPAKALGGGLAMGVIGLDLILTMIRRASSRQPLFRGDRSHLYDQLLQRGWSTWRTLAVIWIVQALFVTAGLLVSRLSVNAALVAVGTLLVLSLAVCQRTGLIRTE